MTAEQLIAALEVATGPSDALDADIAEAVCMSLNDERVAVYAGYRVNPHTDAQDDVWEDVPPYTASLDAALTLVPDYWATLISINETGPGGASLTKGFLLVQAKHSEPAIALCIAALKARGAAP
jgi:hypothetical protein